MGEWWHELRGWIGSRQELGGATFIQTCTGINLAQVGLQQFQEKFRYAENRYRSMLSAAKSNISYTQHRYFLQILITFLLRPIKGIVTGAWYINYALSLAAVGAGVGTLYLNASCQYDYVLLVPPLAYLLLTHTMLVILRAVLWGFGAVVNRVDAEREAEDFVNEAQSTPLTDMGDLKRPVPVRLAPPNVKPPPGG